MTIGVTSLQAAAESNVLVLSPHQHIGGEATRGEEHPNSGKGVSGKGDLEQKTKGSELVGWLTDNFIP